MTLIDCHSEFRKLVTIFNTRLQFPYFQHYRRSAKDWPFVNLLIFWTIRERSRSVKAEIVKPTLPRQPYFTYWGHFKEYGREENLIDRVVRHVEGIWQHSAGAPTYETPQHRCLHACSELVWKLFYAAQSIRDDRGWHTSWEFWSTPRISTRSSTVYGV